MTAPVGRSPIVLDTDVYGASLVPRSPLAAPYEAIIAGRPAFISFQTAAELRFGAVLRGWGPTRMRALDAGINQAVTIHSGPDRRSAYAEPPADCAPKSGHGPGR